MSNEKKEDQKPPEHIEVYFDVRDSGYWYRVNGRYVKLKKGDIQMHFKDKGLRDDRWFNNIREIDWPLWNSQMKRLVDYAGDLAGHRAGIFKDTGGRSYLVMNEARGVWEDFKKKLPEPKWFLNFIQNLLPDEQHFYFCTWLAVALDALRKGTFRPGQVVFLVGPSSCGKSLLQLIVTEILGGRAANPFKYMMGITNFNENLAGAEHWIIEDPNTTTDTRARRAFGNMLKECANNVMFQISAKGKAAVDLPLFRRITVSVNDEHENVSIVPPMDASIQDKVFLFKCTPVALGNDREAIWKSVMQEVPAIRAWLLRNFLKIPKEYQHDRYLIGAWHHAEILRTLSDMANETRLLGIIDQVLFEEVNQMTPPIIIKSMDLEIELKKSKYGFEIEKMTRFPGAIGALLSKLAKQVPERFSSKKLHGYTRWTIKPPVRTKEDEEKDQDNGE